MWMSLADCFKKVCDREKDTTEFLVQMTKDGCPSPSSFCVAVKNCADWKRGYKPIECLLLGRTQHIGKLSHRRTMPESGKSKFDRRDREITQLTGHQTLK